MQLPAELPLGVRKNAKNIGDSRMNNKQYVRYFFKEYIRRFKNPTTGDKRFQVAARIIYVCLALSSLIFIATDSMPLIWLFYGMLAALGLLMIADASWSFWDIVNQIKANGQEANPTTRPQVVIRPSGFSRMEQMRAVAMASRWQYGLIAIFFMGGILVPIGWLKVVSWCLMELSFLWAIQRIWGYRPAVEREGQTHFTTLKLSFMLIWVGFMVFGLYFIMYQLMFAVYSALTAFVIYLIVPPICSIPPFAVGFFLLIRVVGTDLSTTLRNEEQH